MKDLELQEWKKQAIENQKIQNAAKMEHLTKAIEAENMLTDYSNKLIDWLTENREKLIGKKLLNNDGMSKYFKGLFSSFPAPVEPVFGGYFSGEKYKIRACVNGGKYENKTYYCQYFDRVLYDVFKFDANGVCLEVRSEKSSYPIYTIENYLSANDAIKQAKEEIKAIEEKISNLKKQIPYSLHEFRF